jgi:GTPase
MTRLCTHVMLCLQYMLVEPTEERFEHLVTQMKWRLSESEGVGEAIYEIGGIFALVGGI